MSVRSPDSRPTIGQILDENGVGRRRFLKYCAGITALMAMPPGSTTAFAQQLRAARRPTIIYMPFQECTGCIESLTRSFAPTIESLIFDTVSLDYNHTLQAAAGHAAEAARLEAMEANWDNYVLICDGSIPVNDGGIYGASAGESFVHQLEHAAEGAAAIVAVGVCASYGGVGAAYPNPTGAKGVAEIIKNKPIINVPGCPPIPEVMTGTLVSFLASGVPALDKHLRPQAFFGNTIHDRCYRRRFYDRGLFAESFDDEGARNGWCLYKLGCRGPTTYNACATIKWNGGTSWPVESGHGCLGCSEPDFWDQGGFYEPVTSKLFRDTGQVAAGAAAGVAIGAASAIAANARKKKLAAKAEEEVSS
ncbi:MAG: hydrogenase small subunit [Wenzhouxiangellaceae bacterium]|nr:hydrogenase small subunit [Wenzhouxiangellaceae bacterium]